MKRQNAQGLFLIRPIMIVIFCANQKQVGSTPLSQQKATTMTIFFTLTLASRQQSTATTLNTHINHTMVLHLRESLG